MRRRLLLLVVVAAGLACLALAVSGWREGNDLRAVEAWLPAIEAAATEAEIDPWLLAGVVYAESRGQADAISSVGAIGLCQLMPGTAEELAMRIKIDGPPYRAEDNLRMGAAYLHELLQRFDDDQDLALLGYRMGPTRVAREVAADGRDEFLMGLQAKRPSPWDYRLQVGDAAATLRTRAGRR